VLRQFGAVVERASIDEAYLDLSSLVDKRQDAATEHNAYSFSAMITRCTFSPLILLQ
jgi:nucleotidyltransferase/DNA polymerase involved in DNA repair